MAKILIIEDNNEINQMLTELLTENGYETKSAFSGTEGLLYFSMENYQLILLDLMLPGMDGEDVLAKIREKSQVPVIVISAKSQIDGKVELLENGANDYITKPFDVREVIARVHLQLKQSHDIAKDEVNSLLRVGELEINDKNHSIKLKGNVVPFTRLEYNIIRSLFANPKKVFTKQELFEAAWEDFYLGEDKTINVHISNIRNKMKEYTDVNYIETVWGIGFRAGGL